MKLQIRHDISIGIGTGVARAVQHLLLNPRDHSGQIVREWALSGPGIAEGASFIDAFGNRALLANQARPDGEIVVRAAGVVETIDKSGVVGRVPGDPVPALFTRATALTKPDEALLDGLDADTRDRIALFHTLMARVGDGRQSQSGEGQSQEQSGSEPAQLAHRFIGTLRALKIPARFVTGYLAAGEDSPAAFHAWAEGYDEALGWIGFDCALQVCPTERHVRLAAGLDAASAAPVRSVPGTGAGQPLALAVEAAQ